MARVQINYAIGLILVACFFGCSTHKVNPQTRSDAIAPIYCEQGEDCDAKWHRAINFIGSHSGFRLKKVTDQFAQTTGPKGSSGIATTIRKQPLDRNVYRLAVAVDCGRNFIEKSFCSQDRVVQYVAALKRTVRRSPLRPSSIRTRTHKELSTQDIGPAPSTSSGSVRDWNPGSPLPLAIIH